MNQIEEMKNALDDVWQAIGSDVLAMCDNNVAKKEEVIEMVLDANRVEAYGNLSPDTLTKWKSLSFEEKIKLAKETFIFPSYGY